MASATAVGFGDTPPVRVPAGRKPNRRDGAGRAAGLDGCTQGGGGFGGGKDLYEYDACETVALRPDDGKPAVEEETTQVHGQFRLRPQGGGMIRERPELHEMPAAAAAVPVERCPGGFAVAWCPVVA